MGRECGTAKADYAGVEYRLADEVGTEALAEPSVGVAGSDGTPVCLARGCIGPVVVVGG